MQDLNTAVHSNRKFLLALVAAVASTVAMFYGSNPYVQIALAFLTATGVWAVPNKQVG